MTEIIKSFFREEKIEYYTALDYSAVKEINAGLILRSGITPRSVIIFLLPYYVSTPKNISAYAASYDYHIAIRDITSRLIERLCAAYPEYSFRGFGDHSPIDEIGAALCGGLGISADNGLIINESYGSYVFVGDIITDAPPELVGAREPMPIKRCVGCGRCKAACPTGILANGCGDCLSAITQRKGELGEYEVELMRKFDTVWGCDLCQRVCPHNKDPKITPLEFFHRDRIECLSSDVLNALSDEQFKERAFGWRGRAVVKRNLDALGY